MQYLLLGIFNDLPPTHASIQTTSKMKSYPGIREYLRSTASLTQNPVDYGTCLDELNKKSGFADQLGLMVFVIDGPSMSYPFMSRGALDATGHRVDAFFEGGLEFMFDRIVMPQQVHRSMMEQQIAFFERHGDAPVDAIRFKLHYPIMGSNKKIRMLYQQHRIIHRQENGMPIGYQGFCASLPQQQEWARIYQQIELRNPVTGAWEVSSYREYYPGIDDDELLSKREVEILRYISDGLNSRLIADKLSLSQHTVNTHRRNMLRKTNCLNTAELLKFARSVNII